LREDAPSEQPTGKTHLARNATLSVVGDSKHFAAHVQENRQGLLLQDEICDGYLSGLAVRTY
jgi:hypothetical protein